MTSSPGAAGAAPARPALADLGGWPAVLGRLVRREDLSADEAAAALGEILEGGAAPSHIAAFAVGLRMKGETPAELAGLVDAMLERAETVVLAGVDPAAVVDTCGTGGDRSGSINVSTLAALVVAGAGAPVCKHGNRAASSRAGSADVLEALGVTIDLGPAGVARCLAEAGMAFCFAPRFHPAMRHAAAVRRELGVPTVFNFLGPLANPAGVRRQVVGVSDPAMAGTMAGVLAARGARALVVHGHDGLDELTTTGPSAVVDVRDGETSAYTVDPIDLGLAAATAADLRGGEPEANAAAIRRVLAGDEGPHRDIAVLNAAAGLVVAGLADGFAGGVALAAEVLDDGRAAAVLERLVTVSGDAGRAAE